MANPKYFDRVLLGTTTTGTGTYSCGSAVDGYQNFDGAGADSGDTVGYVVVDDLTNPTDWEVVEGVYTAGSPATLSRGTIVASSNGGLAVNWAAGTRYIFSAPSAERMVIGPKATVTDGNLLAWDGADGGHVKDSGQSVSTILPPGLMMPYAGSSAPDGWLLCYGQALSRTTYAALFAVIGTTYGAGDGSTTFNVPDMRGRGAFGLDNMGGSAASRVTSAVSGIAGTTLGAAGGDQRLHEHTHGVNEEPHGHSISGLAGNNSYSVGHNAVDWNSSTPQETHDTDTATTGISIQNAGAGSSQNMPPAMMLNYIIKT